MRTFLVILFQQIIKEKDPDHFKNKGSKKKIYANQIKLKIPITNQKGSEKNQANNQPSISKNEL